MDNPCAQSLGGKITHIFINNMSGRKLQPEEKQIWGKVSRTVSPRRAFKGPKSAKPLPPKGPTTEDFANMLRLPPLAKPSGRGLPQSLDVNQDKRVRRGRVVIDAKIDLHDMTQAMAHQVKAYAAKAYCAVTLQAGLASPRLGPLSPTMPKPILNMEAAELGMCF